jgi:hypothetical protein
VSCPDDSALGFRPVPAWGMRRHAPKDAARAA